MNSTFSIRVFMRGLYLASLAIVLSGCGSNVRLDDPNIPVTDRTGTVVGTEAVTQSASTSPISTLQTPSQPTTAPAAENSAQGDPNPPPESVARLIYFDYDDYTIRPEFMATIEGHARFLNADRLRRVVLEGHTDERGGREYNLALGQKRADAVRRALAVLGVTDAQMESVSFGKEKPALVGSDEWAYSQNRRVELSYR